MFEKHLGPEGVKFVLSMKLFAPDDSWSVVPADPLNRPVLVRNRSKLPRYRVSVWWPDWQQPCFIPAQ
ncbi:hypothetical protein ABIA58_003832 [Pseudomonas frederiksbergensis]